MTMAAIQTPSRLHGKYFLAIFMPALFAVLFWGFFTYLIFQARAAGGYTILVDFNGIGEMHLELWFFPVMLILTILCLFYITHAIFTNRIHGGRI